MPGQRAEGQKLIPVPMTENFIISIDRAFRKAGYSDRSKFIRAAVREKLQRLGYQVDTEETLAPSRVRYNPTEKGASPVLNDKGKGTSSKPASAAATLLRKHSPSSDRKAGSK